MARRVFFSFHFDKDIWRANQVSNSWITKPDRETAGFWNATGWEKVKKHGDKAIKRWINTHLRGTSVTVVLIGTETYGRKWVRYEIAKSLQIGNGLLGIYIHKIKDSNKNIEKKGENSFEYFYFRIENYRMKLWEWKWGKWIDYKNITIVPVRKPMRDFIKMSEGQLSKIFPTYDWESDEGRSNLGNWIEREAKNVGR